MASDDPPLVPLGNAAPVGAALQQKHWRMAGDLSSAHVRMAARAEHFLGTASFDQGPWAVVGLAAGIAAWFAGDGVWQWLAAIALGLGVALAAIAILAGDGRFPLLRRAIVVMALALVAGCALVWVKSALFGARPIARPMVVQLDARILAREERPADHKVRFVVATREPESGRAVAVRVGLDSTADRPELAVTAPGGTVTLAQRSCAGVAAHDLWPCRSRAVKRSLDEWTSW